MQTRPYPERTDGLRVWLARPEQEQLVSATDDRRGRARHKRRLAMLLALHGLRTEELMSVTYGDLRQLAGGEGHVLQVDTAKRERSVREVPVSEELVELMHTIWSAGGLRQSQDLVDVAKRTVRHWISDARDELEWEHSDEIGMHDLRRTWATDTYYTLALAGVPIAEQLTMTWGGWTMSETGRSTFRQTYLGPVPDHIVADVAERLPG